MNFFNNNTDDCYKSIKELDEKIETIKDIVKSNEVAIKYFSEKYYKIRNYKVNKAKLEMLKNEPKKCGTTNTDIFFDWDKTKIRKHFPPFPYNKNGEEYYARYGSFEFDSDTAKSIYDFYLQTSDLPREN